jgi:hypothetical protein
LATYAVYGYNNIIRPTRASPFRSQSGTQFSWDVDTPNQRIHGHNFMLHRADSEYPYAFINRQPDDGISLERSCMGTHSDVTTGCGLPNIYKNAYNEVTDNMGNPGRFSSIKIYASHRDGAGGDSQGKATPVVLYKPKIDFDDLPTAMYSADWWKYLEGDGVNNNYLYEPSNSGVEYIRPDVNYRSPEEVSHAQIIDADGHRKYNLL